MSAPATGETLASPLHPDIQKRLDPDFVVYYNEKIAHKTPTHRIPLSEIRANPAKYAGPWCVDLSGAPGVKNFTVTSKDGHQVKIRSYSPVDEKFGKGPWPIHINFHGGGFVFGDLTADAAFCERLQQRLPIITLDVEYRLCPENRFDHAIEDGWAALEWVHKNASEINGDGSSISLSGISAGGHLAAVTQQLARDAGIPLKLAILTVPCTDYTTYWPTPEGYNLFPSVEAMKNTAMLDHTRLTFFHEQVNNERDRDHLEKNVPQWWKTPLHNTNFKDLCTTFIATAECDPLCDEGEAYGVKVVQAGGMAIFRRYLGMPHPFTHMPLKGAHQYDEDVIGTLRLAHGI
ncbi:alpha/beta-hydrolase [Rhizodiscina lignyota]|uniref:Alpha/beta-hydrolase n=1 Tax=Rhizodiscina lignyota TaxID=1504668 RepID=A0A9P4ITG1_9PEZI|nr:alpha/beta-hydrolase [Rhizodiscina lignyota]